MRYYCVVVATTTNLPWHPTPPPALLHSSLSQSQSQPQRLLRQSLHTHYSTIPRAFFGRSDFDAFAKRAASGELFRDAWRSANDGFEQLLFETKKAAQRIDRQYSVSLRLSAVAESAAARARELDRDFELTQRWRNFTLDFSRNWPKYRKQFNDFLDSPLGRIFATVFFLWFALSGWMFRFFIFSVWILPFAGPLLIGTIANNFVIKGACPACKKQFVGYKNQVVRCSGCKNIVWQPQGDFFSRGSRGSSRRKSDPDIIDVEFEEK